MKDSKASDAGAKENTEGNDSSSAAETGKTDTSDTSASSTADGSSGATASGSTVTTPYPTYTGMTNPFGAGLNVPNSAMIGLNNPFNFGMGTGMYYPGLSMISPLLQPGENIFEKYPLGFKFQYIG